MQFRGKCKNTITSGVEIYNYPDYAVTYQGTFNEEGEFKEGIRNFYTVTNSMPYKFKNEGDKFSQLLDKYNDSSVTNVYQGEFAGKYFNGKGILYEFNKNNFITKYDGKFYNNIISGDVEITIYKPEHMNSPFDKIDKRDIEVFYKGGYINSNPHGIGTLIEKKGNTIETKSGLWVNGEFSNKDNISELCKKNNILPKELEKLVKYFSRLGYQVGEFNKNNVCKMVDRDLKEYLNKQEDFSDCVNDKTLIGLNRIRHAKQGEEDEEDDDEWVDPRTIVKDTETKYCYAYDELTNEDGHLISNDKPYGVPISNKTKSDIVKSKYLNKILEENEGNTIF